MKQLGFLAFLLLFTHCTQTYHISRVTDHSMSMGQPTEDTEITAMIAPYKEALDDEMNEVIGEVLTTIAKSRPESPLGNWFADALFEITAQKFDSPADFAMQNYGGLRIPALDAGPLTRGKIFELMPFDNSLVVVEIPYDEMVRFIDHLAASGGWPVSKQIKLIIKEGKPLSITIGGKPLQSGHTYRVAMPDYIANGGDGLDYLVDNHREDQGLLIRDLIIEYVKTQREVNAQKDGRIVIDQS